MFRNYKIEALPFCLIKTNSMMTNEEYKKFALQIYDKIINIEEGDNYEITNIGELFVLKLYEGFKSLNEPMSQIEIEKDIIALENSLDAKENENNESFFEPEITQDTNRYFINAFFRGLKYAVDSWGDIEYTLLRLGVEEPKRIINSVKNVDGILDSDMFFASYRNDIVNLCKESSIEDLFEFLQVCKYLGSNYKSVCECGIVFYNFLLKKISCDINKLSEILEEFEMTSYFDNLENLFESDDDIEFPDGYKIFIVDLLFLLYYFIYQNPRYLVKFSFYLLYKNTSPQMQEAMYNSFRSGDTNSLIQYEYEWWCSETSKKLDIPFPFSTRPFNKSNTTIVDYNLYYNEFKNQPEICESIDSKQKTENNKVDRNQVINKLKPYFEISTYDSTDIEDNRFITDYLDNVIDLSAEITDSYKSYGFAYILFNSKYFNWEEDKFNTRFVELIESIFKIQIKERRKYYQKDGCKKAKEILNRSKYKKLRGLLNDVTKKFSVSIDKSPNMHISVNNSWHI